MSPNGIISYPDFKLSGTFNGTTSASRWLSRLTYDFKKAGTLKPAPFSLIQAIDMLAEGKAAIYIDSHHRALCDKERPTSADAEKLCSALKFEFPPVLTDIVETPIQDQIRDLAQLETEGLQAYSQRVARLLHKSGGKDKVKGEELPPLEAFALSQIVQAYIAGLWDQELRAAVLARLGECTCLWRTTEVILETKRSREAVERLGGGKNELKQLEQLAAMMPPPPTASPAPEANTGQRAHNRDGYDRRVSAMGASISYQ
jgi:hypothetical protein